MKRPAGLHLLWTIPLALVVGAPFLIWAGLSWCGISGCSGGGFGVDDRYAWQSVVCCLIAGILVFAALAPVPWLRKVRARLVTSAAIGVVYAVVAALVTRAH
ncbi:MAG TPA: hypothetical protein VNT53_03405 [Pseudolysinimonas sp.]|nr:hypothetical protein [Pseudolysinimonas sp.]